MVLNGSGGLLAVSGLRPGDRMLDGGRDGRVGPAYKPGLRRCTLNVQCKTQDTCHTCELAIEHLNNQKESSINLI